IYFIISLLLIGTTGLSHEFPRISIKHSEKSINLSKCKGTARLEIRKRQNILVLEGIKNTCNKIMFTGPEGVDLDGVIPHQVYSGKKGDELLVIYLLANTDHESHTIEVHLAHMDDFSAPEIRESFTVMI